MALTSAQQASRLFKKSMGVGETLTTKEFFSETSYPSNNIILPNQIWSEAGLIQNTAPSLPDLGISGVVQYYSKLSLTMAPGSANYSYYNILLKDAIPFNYGDGTSYNYTLYKSDGVTQIPFGAPGGDWVVDTSAGLLTWYTTVPTGVNDVTPPKISFWRYIGDKGLTQSGETGGFNVHTAVRLTTNSGDTLINYNTSTSGYTTLPSSVDGVTGSTLVEADRILVKNQPDTKQNGIFQVSGSTLRRATDSDGLPTTEVAVGDYTFTMSGLTNAYTGWVLGSTSGNPLKIIPGQDTQVWNFFSASQSYTADGQALQLFGNQFKIILDESDPLSSGLEQNPLAGLRIKPSLLSAITGETSLRTSADSSLSTSISSETSLRTSADSSLDTKISTESSLRTSADVSLETELSTQTSQEISVESSLRTSADSSLELAIINKSGVTSQTAGSGLTYISGDTSLNVNVDNWTIKIISDQLRTPLLFIQTDKLTTIVTGTTGSTNIILDHNPVGQVSAYINGIEYLVSVSGGTALTEMPFYFDNPPISVVTGDILKFDSTVAGFGLSSGIDLIIAKYHYIDETP